MRCRAARGSRDRRAKGRRDARRSAARQGPPRVLGQFTPSEHWLIIADSFAARGKTQEAVGLVQSGLRAHPDDYVLWVGLGNALVDHAGVMTPAAELAYARAAKLAPWSPAPPFFHGLALSRSGDREGALREWKAMLAAAPAEAELAASGRGRRWRIAQRGRARVRPARKPGRALRRPPGGGSCRPRR